MTKNWIAVSALTALVSGLLGWQLYVTARRFNAENDVSRMQPVAGVKAEMAQKGGGAPLQAPRSYNAADFVNIPNQNVFSETRSRDDKTDAQPVAQVPDLTTPPVLIGVMISGNQRQALIVDPTIAGARQAVTRKTGDVIGPGYVITDITDSQIVLENGPKRVIVPLFDGTKHAAQGGKTPILATRVISFGAGGASGAAQPVVMSASGSSRPPQSSVPIGAPRPAGQQPAQQVQQPPAAQQQVRPGIPASQGPDSQGRQVIRTPFGDYPVAAPPKPPNHE